MHILRKHRNGGHHRDVRLQTNRGVDRVGARVALQSEVRAPEVATFNVMLLFFLTCNVFVFLGDQSCNYVEILLNSDTWYL